MRSVFIWCFCQWVGEEVEGGDSGSRDYDYDYDCVVEWWEGVKQLRVDMCWWGGAKIVQSGQHAGVFCMVILTLFCIHEYNVIDGIA